MINVEITRNSGENALGTLRRFSRKVQSAGVIPRMRSIRYSGRVQSHYKIKQKALKKIARRAALAELVKQGKAPVETKRFGRK
jgi:ribosomal protein S21